MTGSFILDYFLLVFLGSCGVFQMAAARGGFQGLVFFRQRLGSFLLGALLLADAFAWFFGEPVPTHSMAVMAENSQPGPRYALLPWSDITTTSYG